MNHPRHRPPCASIAIASRGTEAPISCKTRYGTIRSRSGAALEHTVRDAQSVLDLWNRVESGLPDSFHRLLVDPTLGQVQSTIREVSRLIDHSGRQGIGLDLYFAGHGEESTGNLVFPDGTLSPSQFLILQADEVGQAQHDERTIGVWLDSCYSGAFLIRLAHEVHRYFPQFRLDEGLASCLPDESSWEMDILQHGVFTFTQLHPGNASVDMTELNRAMLEDDAPSIAKGLQGLVASMSSATAFLTEGKQFSIRLHKHVVEVQGGFASIQLDDYTDINEALRAISGFKCLA